MAEKSERKLRVVADNRKARFHYFIDDTMEAGLALTGTEVKSLRSGKATIAESYADARDGEIWLINSYLPESWTPWLLAQFYTEDRRFGSANYMPLADGAVYHVVITQSGFNAEPGNAAAKAANDAASR